MDRTLLVIILLASVATAKEQNNDQLFNTLFKLNNQQQQTDHDAKSEPSRYLSQQQPERQPQNLREFFFGRKQALDARGHADNGTTPGQGNFTTLPSNFTTLPSNFTTLSSNFTTLSNNFTTLPSNLTTLPSNFTTLPSNVTTLPSNFTTLPSNFTTPAANFTTDIPGNMTTMAPDNSTSGNYSAETSLNGHAAYGKENAQSIFSLWQEAMARKIDFVKNDTDGNFTTDSPANMTTVLPGNLTTALPGNFTTVLPENGTANSNLTTSGGGFNFTTAPPTYNMTTQAPDNTTDDNATFSFDGKHLFKRWLESRLNLNYNESGNVTTQTPGNFTTLPTGNFTTAPSNFTTAPSNFTTAPSNSTTAPSNFTTAPSNFTTAPSNFTTAPSNFTTAPSNFTTAPSNFTTAPSNFTTAPSNLTTTASPGNVTSATDVNTCMDISGVWESVEYATRLILLEDSDGSLEGLIREDEYTGYFELEGKRGLNQGATMAFYVLWQGGEASTAYSGQCHACEGSGYLGLSRVTSASVDSCNSSYLETRTDERYLKVNGRQEAIEIISKEKGYYVRH